MAPASVGAAGAGDAPAVGVVVCTGGRAVVGRAWGTTIAGGAIAGAGVVAVGVGAGVRVGAVRREAGTSGATGPCRSGGGCCCGEGAGGSRNSVTEACAGAAASAAASMAMGAKVVRRIVRRFRFARDRE